MGNQRSVNKDNLNNHINAEGEEDDEQIDLCLYGDNGTGTDLMHLYFHLVEGYGEGESAQLRRLVGPKLGMIEDYKEYTQDCKSMLRDNVDYRGDQENYWHHASKRVSQLSYSPTFSDVLQSNIKLIGVKSAPLNLPDMTRLKMCMIKRRGEGNRGDKILRSFCCASTTIVFVVNLTST